LTPVTTIVTDPVR